MLKVRWILRKSCSIRPWLCYGYDYFKYSTSHYDRFVTFINIHVIYFLCCSFLQFCSHDLSISISFHFISSTFFLRILFFALSITHMGKKRDTKHYSNNNKIINNNSKAKQFPWEWWLRKQIVFFLTRNNNFVSK